MSPAASEPPSAWHAMYDSRAEWASAFDIPPCAAARLTGPPPAGARRCRGGGRRERGGARRRVRCPSTSQRAWTPNGLEAAPPGGVGGPERRRVHQRDLRAEAALVERSRHERGTRRVVDRLVVVLVALRRRRHRRRLRIRGGAADVPQDGEEEPVATARRRTRSARPARARRRGRASGDVCIDEPLERERGAARLVEDRVERIAEEEIEIEVAAAVVEDGDIPEEVDALDGRVRPATRTMAASRALAPSGRRRCRRL